MVNVERGIHKFTFHKALADNLNILKKAVGRDWDFKILVSGDGMTRTGKSTIACQMAIYLDPDFNMDQVVFRGDKLIEQSLKLGTLYNQKKGIAIVYDEAKEGLDSKKAMNAYSQQITDYFSECGWLNQYLIVVLPEFFDLNKTVALNQSICLINCYTKRDFERGFFGFYNRVDKRYLYIKGKKWNNYSCQNPTFQGTFNKYFPLDITIYEKLKLENQRALKKMENPNTEADRLWKRRFTSLCKVLRDDETYTQIEIGKICKMHPEDVSHTIAKMNKLDTGQTI